jgi:glucokinase
VILAGDVGGTKTRLGLFDGEKKLHVTEVYQNRVHASLGEIIAAFLAAHPAMIDAACIGVAGPVKDNRAVVTNLPWSVDAGALADRFSFPHSLVINDHEATAWGISRLTSNDFEVLNPGKIVTGSAALIAAGTGLGQAGLFWNGSEHVPIPSEGGHSDFAPRNQLEIELLQYLQRKLGKRVSYERALSGPGLLNIYTFLRDTGRGEEPEWLTKKLATGDPPAEITAAAGECRLADQAVELFVSLYGAAAGNVALHFMATAGLYIAGGIAPKIVSRLKGKTFLDSYLDKGRLSPLLGDIPVRVIMNKKTALIGAARRALRSTHTLRYNNDDRF